jgi:O-antigen/teichoic acid export membrane protein
LSLEQGFIAKRIVSNALVNGVAKVIVAASGIILTPILISGLGKYEYGLWLLVGQVIAFLLVADMGVANSVGRLISKYDALNSTEGKNNIYSSALAIFFLVMFVIVLLSLVFIPVVIKLLNIESEYISIVKHVFYIMVANLVITFPLRVGRGLMQSIHRFDSIDIVITFFKVLQAIIIVLLFYVNSISLLVLAWLIAVTNILSELIIFIKAKQAHKGIAFSMKFVKLQSLSELFSMGGASVFLSISSSMLQQGLIFLIGGILGILYVPLFAIPSMLLVVVGTFIGRIGITLMPIASAYDSLSEVKKILSLSVYAVRYTFMLGALAAVYIYLYGKKLLTLWLPSEQMSTIDIGVMYNLLLLLIIPFTLARSNQGNRAILLSTGSHWLISNMLFMSSVVGLVFAVILVKFTSLGIYGLAIGWVIKLLLGDYFLTLYFFIAKYDVDVKRYMITAYVKNILTIFALIIIGKAIMFFIGEDTLLNLFTGSLLFTVVSFVLIYFVCVEKKHVIMIIPLRFKNILKV